MAMFRKRLMRDPSPYLNQRITFLDQDMITALHNDYELFSNNQKSFTLRNYFVEHVNGTAPFASTTNKKWFVNVDHLYACLFINGNHWVALHIDLPSRMINIYDSIPQLTTKNEMAKQCLFLRRMIPAMMSAMIPETVRKKSNAMLELKRIKNIPLNKDHGDCAVYALEYIECLALGTSFDGISDENMLAIRIKLAAELFDELRVLAGPHNHDPRAKALAIPHLMDST